MHVASTRDGTQSHTMQLWYKGIHNVKKGKYLDTFRKQTDEVLKNILANIIVCVLMTFVNIKRDWNLAVATAFMLRLR